MEQDENVCAETFKVQNNSGDIEIPNKEEDANGRFHVDSQATMCI